MVCHSPFVLFLRTPKYQVISFDFIWFNGRMDDCLRNTEYISSETMSRCLICRTFKSNLIINQLNVHLHPELRYPLFGISHNRTNKFHSSKCGQERRANVPVKEDSIGKCIVCGVRCATTHLNDFGWKYRKSRPHTRIARTNKQKNPEIRKISNWKWNLCAWRHPRFKYTDLQTHSPMGAIYR